jgi:serine/threonine-protein kinase RsbW
MRSPSQDGSFEVTIASDPTEVQRVQERIETELKRHHFDDRDIFGIRLALEEALVNAIKHGNRMDRSKKVHVRCSIRGDRFEVGVCDEGPGFDVEDVPDPCAEENLERPCGRGLLLIRHYMTEVTYHPPGNRLTMAKVRMNGSNGSNGSTKAPAGRMVP